MSKHIQRPAQRRWAVPQRAWTPRSYTSTINDQHH